MAFPAKLLISAVRLCTLRFAGALGLGDGDVAALQAHDLATLESALRTITSFRGRRLLLGIPKHDAEGERQG